MADPLDIPAWIIDRDPEPGPKKTIVEALMLCRRRPAIDDMYARTLLANAEMEADQILSDLSDDGFQIGHAMPDPGDRPNFVSKGELLDEIERLKAIIVADTHVLLSKRPVAFRVYGSYDKWILLDDEQAAVDLSEKLNGAMMQGLYARDGK